MIEFSTWDIIRNLLFAMRWTVLLSLAAFAGAAALTTVLLFGRLAFKKAFSAPIALFMQLFQGTPVLMQLFLVFFALPLVDIRVTPWIAAVLCLTLYASAYLLEIWESAVRAVPRGQWEACRVLGFPFSKTLFLIILPQAVRLGVAPTIGFTVQLIKGTALTSIIGFEDLTKTATILTNATFRPFEIYSYAAIGYFALCFPLSLLARRLEARIH